MTFVIAEIGVNHNGSVDSALELVEVAADAGAHAAKFQSFRAASVAARHTATVDYQKASGADDQFTLLKNLELDEDAHRVLARRCEERGIEFMSTAFDHESLNLLCDIGIRRIKVPSGEITNIPYLRDCARRGLPIIVSTGMADLDEVREAVTFLRTEMVPMRRADPHGLPDLAVLHCTTAYPTALRDVNLAAMLSMSRELDVAVGYSDHTEGIFVPPIAVALGAEVIEKHVTLDRSLPGPDHAASIEPNELKEMIDAIGAAERLLGDGVKKARPAEEQAKTLVRRGLKAARDLAAGTVLSDSDIALLRPATGLAPRFLDTTVGKRLRRDLKAGSPIESSDIGQV